MKKTIIGGIWLAVWMFFFCVGEVQCTDIPRSNTLLLLRNEDTGTFINVCKELRRSGFLPFHKIPPRIVIGYDPGNIAESYSQSNDMVTLVTRDPVPIATMSGIDGEVKPVLNAWNNLLLIHQGQIPSEIRGERPADMYHGSDCIMAETSPPDSRDRFMDQAGILMKSPVTVPYGAGTIDTSVFYVGDVVVTIICPESNGNIDPDTEEWTSAEESAITSRVIAAYDALMLEEGGSHITYTYDFLYRQTCDYEAATRWISSLSTTWVEHIMDNLGYAGPGTARSKTRAFCNDQRDLYDTHWSHVIYMVDVTNTGKQSAYAYHGGPYHLNDNMDEYTTIMHETGHIFFAFDEYASSACTCTESAGYLNYENQNCRISGCLYNVDCTMFSNTPPYCKYTRGQIGWADTDCDGLPDVVDTYPETTLNPYIPDPTAVNMLTYTGSAVVSPLENLNPFGSGLDISINTIQSVEYRIDNGTWSPAVPTDTAFDGPLEEFHFTTLPLMNGLHLIEVRAVNNYGNIETTHAYDYVTVMAPPSTAVPTPTGTWFTPTIIPSPTPTMYFTYLLGTRTPTPVTTSTITPTATVCAYTENLDSDPGWTVEGGWEFGRPMGLGGLDAGYPDPDRGYTGLNVYGYNLAGDYPNNIPVTYYLTSESFDCSSLANVTISFFGYLNVEGNIFDHATLEVSNDGTRWINIWQNGIDRITDNSWTEYYFDISTIADGRSSVFIRWGIGCTDSSLQFSGWNIDDLRLCGDSILTPTPTPVHTPVNILSDNTVHYAVILIVLNGVFVFYFRKFRPGSL
jgi:hypothetical protein